MTDTPSTPGKMVDRLHEMFGIGVSDDIASSIPWHRDRMIQIAKLKAMLKSRRASLTEVYIAAEYARDTGKTPHEIWQVFALIPEAMKHRFHQIHHERQGVMQEEIQDAIDEAIEQGEDAWADRLMRASNQADALREWRAR